MPKKLKKHSAIFVSTENKCDLCTGSLCCTYITEEIALPRSKADFNHLLWQISHDNVELYKDSDGWTLLFKTICSHLELDGRCGIYDIRPQICREYTNDYCEYDSAPEDGWELHFKNHQDLYTYVTKRFKHWP
ncbi:MAG: YkgJ family cysteine cluster protein [Gammaproteobacteria bacterium]|nr:YkgJ family cysteine cluster protein [Gammaproteobacteria bacterium]